MSDKGSDPNAVPWYWHLYRPEVLMVYILAGLGLIFYFMDQPDLNLSRIYPMENGTALAVGFDDQDTEDPLLQVWLTGIDEEAEWTRELEGNFVPAPVKGFDIPVFAHSQQLAFMLMGKDDGIEQRLSGIVCLSLESGELLWSNFEQPAGDAYFGSVYTWEDKLVTTHLAPRPLISKVYVVGRNPKDGSMIWTKVFDLPNPTDDTPWQSRISFLPEKILVDMDSLTLLDVGTGNILHSWEGNTPSFNGGWIFYQNGPQFRTLEISSLADSLLHISYPDSVDGIALDPVPGYSGFFDGFPIHFSDRIGLHSFRPGNSSPDPDPEDQSPSEQDPSADNNGTSATSRAPNGKFTASPLSTIYPNGRSAPILNARSSFLTQDWPRYLPLFCSLYNDDTLRKYFPETLADRSMAGDRLIIMDLLVQRPALVGKQLLKEPWQGQLATYEGFHYFIGTDPEQPQKPLVLQFDGNTGSLSKALISDYEFKGLKQPYPHQPVGGRIWIAGDKQWAALSIPELELTFTASDSVQFRDVSEMYREKLGYGDQ